MEKKKDKEKKNEKPRAQQQQLKKKRMVTSTKVKTWRRIIYLQSNPTFEQGSEFDVK